MAREQEGRAIVNTEFVSGGPSVTDPAIAIHTAIHTADQAELTVHPLAEKFPDLSPKEFEELKKSITEIGQLEPIYINNENQILDGKHRYKACLGLKRKPWTQFWKSSCGKHTRSGITEAEFIFASNFNRRNLTDDQRVMIAAEFLPLIQEATARAKAESLEKARAALTREPVNQNSGSQSRDTKTMHANSAPGKLAAKAKSTRHKAEQAIAVKSDPELADKVRKGEMKLKDAAKKVKVGKARGKTLRNKKTSRKRPVRFAVKLIIS